MTRTDKANYRNAGIKVGFQSVTDFLSVCASVLWRKAARIPLSKTVGVGGQPGIVTSTGIIFSTAPQLAYETPNSPPSQAQLPAAITILGEGVASQVRRKAVSMCRDTGPVTNNASAWRGEATK